MKKGVKTTVVAIIALIIILLLMVLLYLGKITANELFKGFSVVGTTAALFIGFLSKDYNSTHSKD